YALVALLMLPFLAVGAGAATYMALAAGDPPDNDEFVDAEAVTHTFSGTTRDATGDTGEIAAGVVDDGQTAVWYTWTAPHSAWAHITPAAGGSGAAPPVKVYVGDTLDELERVDEDATGDGDGSISVPAVAGNDYRIAVIGS